MMTYRKLNWRGLILSQTALIALASLAGCGGPKTFAGQTPISVVGQPPAPPAPPPPPPPKKEEPPARVELRDNKIEIREKIQFEHNSSTIKEVSHSLLNEVAKVIKENPQIKKLRIEGHASSDGADDYNLRLSDARAKAVREYLISQGVAADSLVAQGFGETKPIATNDTEEGREKNRRVEFNVVEQDVTKKKVEVDPKTGQERIIETKTITTTEGK